MSVTITTDNVNGETPSTVADKVRDLPANQGLNDYDMWVKIDAEIAAVQSAQGTKFRQTEAYVAGNKHRNK